jgi:hypothetical protein
VGTLRGDGAAGEAARSVSALQSTAKAAREDAPPAADVEGNPIPLGDGDHRGVAAEAADGGGGEDRTAIEVPAPLRILAGEDADVDVDQHGQRGGIHE